MSAVFILVVLIVLLLTGLPIAFVLGGFGIILLLLNDLNLVMVPQALFGAVDNFILLAAPLFILMSNVLLKGGVGRDLFAAVQTWVGHWPGGLAVATIVSCAIFAAISGSSVATAATIGVVAIPEMINRGYQPNFVYGLLAAGGTLGILIPPSIPMIVYGVVTEESIVHLFVAGVGPGLLLAGGFIVFSILYAKYSGAFTPVPKAEWPERVRTTLRATPTFVLAAIIILGIYLGIFTPTEAAGIGLTCSLILTVLLLRTVGWKEIREAVMESMQTTVTLLLIVAGAKVFGKAITLYRVPYDVSILISENIDNGAVFIVVVCFVLLIMGFFLESLSMLLIMVPVLHPSLGVLGIDPIWFGIMFVIMIECALITPPVGLNLFVIQAVAKTGLGDVVRGVWPFIIILLASIVAIYLVPDIALYLPFKF